MTFIAQVSQAPLHLQRGAVPGLISPFSAIIPRIILFENNNVFEIKAKYLGHCLVVNSEIFELIYYSKFEIQVVLHSFANLKQKYACPTSL
jgi:hypothetical protein